MRMTSSIEVVMQLAGQEAASARFGEIGPEHVLAAVLKFAELPVVEVRNIAPGAEAVKQLADEVHAVRQELVERGVDSTQTRRRLRAELGRGGGAPADGRLRRSPAARAIFKAAEKLATESGSGTLNAPHLLAALLASPTPAMVKVLGDALEKRAGAHDGTPLLDKYGIDLTRNAAEGKLHAVRGLEAECKALLRILSESRYAGVLLVTDNDEIARDIVVAVANAIGRGDVPVGLKGRRLIDLTVQAPGQRGGGESSGRLEGLLGEAATVAGVILLVPPLRTSGDDWSKTLKAALEGDLVKCICRVSLAAYVGGIQKDPGWRRLAHAMWIGEARERELPKEL